MGYFPNGSSCEVYQDHYCVRCVHRDDPDNNKWCPILMLHYDWNYEQLKNTPEGKAKKRALDLLIPTDMKHKHPGIYPAECSMFVERPPEPVTVDERFPESVHPAYRKPS